MDPTTTIALAAGVVVLALVGVLVAGRRHRDRATAPIRLGPAWSPPGAPEEESRDGATAPQPPQDERVAILCERTEIEPHVVGVVLNAWDEHLAVLGLLDLPISHHYRVYDPYDPPVAERRGGRPVADPVRVARDAARRESVTEGQATTVLTALLSDSGAPHEPE